MFLLCIIYESIARRLGVKVRLTATSVHNFISWSSSWPENKYKNPTCYLIDIASNGAMRKATICPVTKKLPEHYKGSCLPDVSILLIILITLYFALFYFNPVNTNEYRNDTNIYSLKPRSLQNKYCISF